MHFDAADSGKDKLLDAIDPDEGDVGQMAIELPRTRVRGGKS